MSDFSIQAFEEASQQNGVRFWYAHVVMEVLGYESWQSFQGVVHKAMGACTKVGVDPTEEFKSATFHDLSGREHKTYKLTRYAVFMLTQSADSKKPQVMMARAALAAIADALIADRVHDQDLLRVEARQDLTEAERQLCGVAQQAGVGNKEFGLFKDAGFRGMYNMSLRELRARKGVDQKQTPYDYMGLEETAGNLFRVTQTTARLKRDGVKGLRPAMGTAETVGREVRRMMIQNSGVAPENLPAEEDVRDVKKRLKDVQKKMVRHDGPQKALPKPRRVKE